MEKNRNIYAQIVLGLVLTAGVVMVLPLLPGLGLALKLFDPNPRRARHKFNRSFNGLVKSGKIVRTKEGYRVTSKGAQEVARGKFDAYQLPARKQWDKKWRIICFDIPEKRKYVRHLVQRKLVELGFYRLQDSVFIHPQPCGEFLRLAQDAFFIQKHVRGMVVTELDDENMVLRHFRLTR